MATGKKSFILYCDLIDEVDHLTDEEKGKLFQHLLEYVNDMNPVMDDRVILGSWKHIQRQLKRDLEKYEGIKEKRSEAGKASAEKRKQESANPTSVESVKHRSTNPTVNVTDTVTDTVNVTDKEIRELTFREQVAQHSTYEALMLDEFADYWTESNPKGKKLKFELQKTFDIARRLKKWSSNNFNTSKESTMELPTEYPKNSWE